MLDIFETINEETQKQETSKSISTLKKDLDDENLIPVAYQICKLVDGRIENGVVVSGKKEIIDTFHCDRSKNYIPNQRAIGKANILKAHDKNNIYFVIGMYSQLKQRPIKQTFVVVKGLIHEIIHEA